MVEGDIEYTEHIGITEFRAKNGRIVLKLFDTLTGEIFEDSKYNELPFTPVNPLPRFAKSEGQALDFRSAEHRKFVSHNNIWFGDMDNFMREHGEDILKQFLCLTKRVRVHNILFIGRDELCDLLSCSNSNLNRKLKIMERKGIISYTTKKLTIPREVKILLNPSYFWYGCNSSRMNEWLSYWCPRIESDCSVEVSCIHMEEYDNIGVTEYSSEYDIGVFDDHRDSFGDKGFTENQGFLTPQELMYIVHGV